jgi:hypothetical protein
VVIECRERPSDAISAIGCLSGYPEMSSLIEISQRRPWWRETDILAGIRQRLWWSGISWDGQIC